MKEEKVSYVKIQKGSDLLTTSLYPPNLIKNTEDKTLINVQAIFSKQRDKDTYSWESDINFIHIKISHSI